MRGLSSNTQHPAEPAAQAPAEVRHRRVLSPQASVGIVRRGPMTEATFVPEWLNAVRRGRCSPTRCRWRVTTSAASRERTRSRARREHPGERAAQRRHHRSGPPWPVSAAARVPGLTWHVVASGGWAVPHEGRRRVAMAAQTEIVEAGFGAHPDFRAAAAVTADARIGAGLVTEIMVAEDAVDRPMLIVREVERQGFCAAAGRCAQRQAHVGPQERDHCQCGNAGADQNEP